MYIPDIAAFIEEGYKPGETVICTRKVKHMGSTYTDQFDYLKSLVPESKHKDLKLNSGCVQLVSFAVQEGEGISRRRIQG